MHHPGPGEVIQNWSHWTEKNVKSMYGKGCILLICGKKLSEILESVTVDVQMYKGFIWTLTLKNMLSDEITKPYFMPILIDEENKEFIPSVLKEKSYYIVQTSSELKVVVKNESLHSLITRFTKQPPLSSKHICIYLLWIL